MIDKKFGSDVVEHIRGMTAHTIRRRHHGQSVSA
jgi:hypothetical protein